MKAPLFYAVLSLTTLCTASAYAQETPFDPTVTIKNESSKTIKAIIYTEVSKKQHIIKHHQIVAPHSTHSSKKGIDYYAKANSGAAQDQHNRVVVLIYDNKTGNLLTDKTKIIDTYGSKDIFKDKLIILDVGYKPKNEVTIHIKNDNKK